MAADYVLLAASEDEWSRSELRDHGDRYEAVYLRAAVGGGWYVENSITVLKQPSFTCPRCGAVSHNPTDAVQGYCGRCHDWTSPERRNQ